MNGDGATPVAARGLARACASPIPYATWAAFVCLALAAAYLGDPYVFGFATLALAWLSAAATLVGLAVVFFSRAPTRAARVVIVVSLALTLCAVGQALRTLRGFHWP